MNLQQLRYARTLAECGKLHRGNIEFNISLLDCRFICLQQSPDRMLAELQFIFENKGFVEHKLWNLNVSVHTLDAEDKLTAEEATRAIRFGYRLLPEIQLVPKKYDTILLGRAFVR